MTGAAKRIVLEVLGWTLLLIGVAALFLPGPGLLCIFAGLALLSQQYDWAERRLEPVRLRALRGAAEGVETWPRICFSLAGILLLVGCGFLWIASPPVPAWWPLADSWWLPGGVWTAVTQIGSGIIALALMIYAYRRFHGKPWAVEALEKDIDVADEAHRTEGDSGSHAGMR